MPAIYRPGVYSDKSSDLWEIHKTSCLWLSSVRSWYHLHWRSKLCFDTYLPIFFISLYYIVWLYHLCFFSILSLQFTTWRAADGRCVRDLWHRVLCCRSSPTTPIFRTFAFPHPSTELSTASRPCHLQTKLVYFSTWFFFSGSEPLLHKNMKNEREEQANHKTYQVNIDSEDNVAVGIDKAK